MFHIIVQIFSTLFPVFIVYKSLIWDVCFWSAAPDNGTELSEQLRPDTDQGTAWPD